MGLFFNSRADNIKREIITLVGKINGAIKSLVTEMDNEGITLYNYKRFKSYIYTIDEYHARVNSLVLQLPSSKVDSLTVPWLDGRILPFFMYDGSYNLVMTQIETELRQTIEKLNEEEEKKRLEEEKRKREELRKQEEERRKREEEEKEQLRIKNASNSKSIITAIRNGNVTFSVYSDSDIFVDWGHRNEFFKYTPDPIDITDIIEDDFYQEYQEYMNSKIVLKGDITRIFHLGGICVFAPEVLDVSKHTKIKSIRFEEQPVKVINASKCPALTKLSCGGNQFSHADLKILNVNGCAALSELSCNYNKLTSLDTRGCIALTNLGCSGNQLTSLDISNNTALKSLWCDDNQLTSLDVSKNIALTSLHCEYNQLTSLDVSGCTALTELDCRKNQLTSLDVSKNTALTKLVCTRNQLTSLDVSGCTALENLDCDDNQLTSLDVSKNTALTKLVCTRNQLTSLDVSGCTALTYLSCYDNQFTAAEMNKIYEALPTVEAGDLYCNKLGNPNIAKQKGWNVH